MIKTASDGRASWRASKQLILSREVLDDRLGRLGADDRGQLLAAGAAHARQRTKRAQQLIAALRTDAVDVVELGAQRRLVARRAMKRDGEPVRFVADALEQLQ